MDTDDLIRPPDGGVAEVAALFGSASWCTRDAPGFFMVVRGRQLRDRLRSR